MTSTLHHTDKFVALLKEVIEDHFNGDRSKLNEARRSSQPGYGYSVECATFHLGGLRRMGYSTTLMELMEAYPDSVCFAFNDDMVKRLKRMKPEVEDARLKVAHGNDSLITFRQALQSHWNGVGHSFNRLLIFVDTGISGFDPSTITALQKAAPQFGCPYLIVLLG